MRIRLVPLSIIHFCVEEMSEGIHVCRRTSVICSKTSEGLTGRFHFIRVIAIGTKSTKTGFTVHVLVVKLQISAECGALRLPFFIFVIYFECF